MNKSLFFVALFALLAVSQTSSIVSSKDAAAQATICNTLSSVDGSCAYKGSYEVMVSSFEPDESFSPFTVWQLFRPNGTFPYQIEELYVGISTEYSDMCEDDDCKVSATVYIAPVEAKEYEQGAAGCPKYTLVPTVATATEIGKFDDVELPGSGMGDVLLLRFAQPYQVFSSMVYIGVTIDLPDDNTDEFDSFHVVGFRSQGNTYCHPHAMDAVLESDDPNPFMSVFLNAKTSKPTISQASDIPGWTGTLEQYNDDVCQCGKGATDPACVVNPESTDCTTEGSVCWEGVCKDVKWKPEANPLHGPQYEACSPRHYGSDDICDLGCGGDLGRAALDPDCFFGRNTEISYPGASRECSREANTCGPEKWTCPIAQFNDGQTCDCDCGAQDPDCNDINITTTCPGDLLCEEGKCTVPKGWTCAKEEYNDGKKCHCGCGVVDPDCYVSGRPSNCPTGRHCSSKAVCITDVCGDGEVNPTEGQQCDSGKHCTSECMCEDHYGATSPPGPDCQGICGDKYVVEGEECDSTGGCLPNCTCDKKYKASNGKCVGCGNGVVDDGEECDGGENCNLQTCKCKSGYESESGSNGCTKKSNLVVVIVASVAAAVVVIAAACIIVFVLVPCINRRKEAGEATEEGDVNMEDMGGETTTVVEKPADGENVSPLNSMCVLKPGSPKMTAAPFVGQRNYIKETWSVNPEETDFNTSGLEVEVGATQQQVFELRNMAPSQMQFSVNVPRSNKFFIAVFPEKGAVASGSSTTFKVQITLYCNVALDQVPFAISIQFEGDEKNQQYTLVPMTLRAQRSNRIDYDDLVFEETVGEGSFGSVWRGKYQGQVVAIKTLRTITESALKDFLREIEMLAQFNNPYIMGYFGSVITNDKLCMVIEYLSMGSLSALLKQYHLSPRLKTRLALDSVKGLAYLHTLNIMHRDIKPGNVLVSSFDPSLPKAICKIADFGTSRVLNGSAEDQAALQKGLGTPLYMAPEILGSNKTYTQSADVYSFGIMLAHIWNEKSPYSDLHFDTPWALANYVSSGNRPQIDEGCPQAYYQLMTQCWQADPSQRPSFQQCVEFLEQLNNLFAEQPEEPDFVHYTQKLE